MKLLLLLIQLMLCSEGCAWAQSVKKITLSAADHTSGYYLALEPEYSNKTVPVSGVLVLLSGFSQQAESIFPETRLGNVAYANNILTVCFAAGYKAYADSEVTANLTAVLKDVMKRYKVSADKFVMGGYSAGGTIALRYAELCNQYPARYQIKPRGVFMVDSPIDIFTLWDMMEETKKANFSEPAVAEATEALDRMRHQFGEPKDNITKYASVTPFSMNPSYTDNEKYLAGVAVRAYHDVDIAWRLVNRRQTVRHANFYVTSELINRLLLMGHKEAEFIQSDRKGYRSDGQRHPHSWNIVDEVDCVQWMKRLLK